MSLRRLDRNPNQEGFTIIELLLATALLSVILLVASIMMTNIGNLFNKGVDQSQAQDNARTITDQVVKDLQLSSGNVQTAVCNIPTCGITVNAYCIGTTAYSYAIGYPSYPVGIQGVMQPIFHVLWRYTLPSSTCAAVDLTLTNPDSSLAGAAYGAELIGHHSRLINFNISNSAPYSVKVGVAYGDDDLLCSPVNNPGTCSSPPTPAMTINDFTTSGNLACIGGTADQFCATATLNSVVVPRL